MQYRLDLPCAVPVRGCVVVALETQYLTLNKPESTVEYPIKVRWSLAPRGGA
jgi:hypothetical protein